MITINTRFTQFVWYAANVTIASLPSAVRFNLLRAVNNNAGAAFSSYKYGRGVNSYTTIKTGDVLSLDANGITPGTPSTYFQIDNGVPSGGSVNIPPFVFTATASVGEPLTLNTFDGFGPNMKYHFSDDGDANNTITYSLNGGSPLTASQLNTAIDALDSPTINANGYSVSFTLTRASDVAVTKTITATWFSL